MEKRKEKRKTICGREEYIIIHKITKNIAKTLKERKILEKIEENMKN